MRILSVDMRPNYAHTYLMTDNKQLIQMRTDQLADALGVKDQLEGMTASQKLANIAIRLNRLSGPQAKQAVDLCLQLQAMAARYAA